MYRIINKQHNCQPEQPPSLGFTFRFLFVVLNDSLSLRNVSSSRISSNIVPVGGANRMRNTNIIRGDLTASIIMVRNPPEKDEKDRHDYWISDVVLITFGISSTHGGVAAMIPLPETQKTKSYNQYHLVT